MQSRYPLQKKWTTKDDERLKVLAAAGRGSDEIGKELDRSAAAIRVRAWQHGITLRKIALKRTK